MTSETSKGHPVTAPKLEAHRFQIWQQLKIATSNSLTRSELMDRTGLSYSQISHALTNSPLRERIAGDARGTPGRRPASQPSLQDMFV